jgi:phytanoyl-CoA hydroxylase
MDELPKYQAPAGGKLTPEMLADYREAGVLILENFISADKCRQLRERTLELVDAFDPGEVKSVFSAMDQTQIDDRYFEESGDKIRFFFEGDAFDEAGNLRQDKHQSLNKMGHAMHDLDPVFDTFSRTPELAAAVKSLGYSDPGIIQSMVIFKPPRIGGEVYCHQDSTFVYTEPQSCVGFWFALEDATLENGCMQFIPGEHKRPLRERQFRGPDGKLIFETLDETPFPEDKRLPAEASKGTLVIFDGRTPHLSGPNASDKSRLAYTLHVIDKAAHYPAENWLQRRADLPLRGFDS